MHQKDVYNKEKKEDLRETIACLLCRYILPENIYSILDIFFCSIDED